MASQTMKLIQQPSPASTALQYTPSHPVPTPSHPQDHLIRLHAAAPCRHELLWESADPHIFPDGRPSPRLPCPEGSGEVVSAPEGSPFEPGARVFFAPTFQRTGCLAEYILLRTEEMVKIPGSMSYEEAAAAPVSSLTAYQGLFDHGGLVPPSREATQSNNSGKKILITGASGAVGLWAVQLAHAARIPSITALCSPSKSSLPRSLGATSTTDRHAVPLDEEYDLIFDTVGGEVLRSCWKAVKKDGSSRIISVGASLPEDVKPDSAGQVEKAEWFLFDNSGSELEKVAALIEHGLVKPLVDSVFTFEEYEAAFEKVDQGLAKGGKVVINIP